jgi:putative transposase
MIDYKSKLMIEVEPHNTTIDCSRCGNKVQKSLAVRIHRCDRCGLAMDRDYNASLNILQKGLQILELTVPELPMVHREVTPVETLMGSRKQEEAIGLVR